MSKSSAADYKAVMGWHMNGWEIEIAPDRNPELPPLVEVHSQGLRVDKAQFAATPEDKPERKVTLETVDRVEDGEIHVRLTAKSYVRRPSKIGGRPVQCNSWAEESRDHERLAASLGHESFEQLRESLVSDGLPEKSARQKAASELNRSLGSVTGKLQALRKKGLAKLGE